MLPATATAAQQQAYSRLYAAVKVKPTRVTTRKDCIVVRYNCTTIEAFQAIRLLVDAWWDGERCDKGRCTSFCSEPKRDDTKAVLEEIVPGFAVRMGGLVGGTVTVYFHNN